MPDFDGFADQYDQTFELAPFRTHIEAHSVLKALGDVNGQAWLDVACGTGPYSRALRKRGAARVLGVDLSPDMLRRARAAEEQEPLGIEYVEHDAGTMPSFGDFDGALGVYLLHYGTDETHLRGMCASIAANLRPGGRFITYQLNPELSREPDYYLKYGTELSLDPRASLADGDAIGFRINLGDFRSPEVLVYYWSRATLDDALRPAGFERVRWIRPVLAPQVEPGPFQDYLDQPLCVVLECVKG